MYKVAETRGAGRRRGWRDGERERVREEEGKNFIDLLSSFGVPYCHCIVK